MRRKTINIILLTLVVILGVLAACLYRLPFALFAHDGAQDSDAVAEGDSAGRIERVVDTVYVANVADAVAREVAPPRHEDGGNSGVVKAGDVAAVAYFGEADLRKMVAGHPFSREAAKVLAGKLDGIDSLQRRSILNYCEHFRTAYTTKDIDFLRQVFSENALIIVGHAVKTGKAGGATAAGGEKVRLSVQSKKEYLRRLTKVFEANKEIDVKFSDFRIMRHPTADGIYGVTLRQRYTSDLYSDDGWLFLLWDFRNPSMPEIHVRTWQSHEDTDAEDVFGIADFNLE